MKFINAGYSNLIAADRIVLVAAPDSAPVKRLMQDAKDDGRAIDLTCGKRTRAERVTVFVFFTVDECVVLLCHLAAFFL